MFTSQISWFKQVLISIFSLQIASCFFVPVFAQQVYKDGRPAASARIACEDEGIVLRYGNGPDSCDTYGAREAVVNKEGNLFYLFYDGAGKDGWKACLAVSSDLRSWNKKGAILQLGSPGFNDAKSASAPWVIKAGDKWHMFYMGTPNTTAPPNRIPAFPYLTMKAWAKSLGGPWNKQYELVPFSTNENTYYSVTASPGFIVRDKLVYRQFFSAATLAGSAIKRTLSIARTKNLDGAWQVDPEPIFPSSEQVENSSLYFQPENKTWFLFTNHIGIDSSGAEYTDAIWVYWSKQLDHWNSADKAIVLDSSNCSWSKGAIGMPSVIKMGNKLALLYDGFEGRSLGHMRRSIGLAWMKLPIEVPRK